MRETVLNIEKSHIEIKGGTPLVGTVSPDGAKNSALIQLAAVALVEDGFVTLSNVPSISDAYDMFEMLREIGLTVNHDGHEVQISGQAKSFEFSSKYGSRIRASLAYLGAVVSKKGQVVLPMPGGDKIGPRPIDIHISVLEAFGVDVEVKDGFIYAKAKKMPLDGQTVYLRYPSVLATVNAIILGVHAKGKTVLHNVAKEPEIVDLTNLLTKMGANIRGVGTDKITVDGVDKLHTAYHEVMPDRLEAAALMMSIVMSGGHGTIDKTIPEHNEPLMDILRQTGVKLEVEADKIHILDSTTSQGFEAETRPFPCLATDVQPILTALALKSEGPSKLIDTVHPERFDHAREMTKMGADIEFFEGGITINGKTSLRGAEVVGRDIRSAVTLINTALSIEDTSYVYGVEHLERGHSNYIKKLKSLGAQVEMR